MKFQLLQENLNNILSLITKIVSAKVDLPILANILVTAEKNQLIFSATNLEMSMIIKITAQVEKTGKLALPAKTFQEVVLSLPPGKITLEQEQEKVKIICKKTFVQINGFSSEEFPLIPQIKPSTESWKIKGKFLKKICSQVAFAAATDESRPVLQSVLFRPEKEQLLVVATDGYRLSKKELKGSFKEDAELLIPARTLLEMGRILSEEDQEIVIVPDKKQQQVTFLTKEVQLISRLIEGNFPDFEKILPTSFQTEVILDKEELERALKTASIFARESANIIKFKIQNTKFKISADAAQVGENETELTAKIKGEAMEIAFNFRFIQDFLNAVEDEEIILKVNDSLSPAVFTSQKTTRFLHLIMPVRIQTSS